MEVLLILCIVIDCSFYFSMFTFKCSLIFFLYSFTFNSCNSHKKQCMGQVPWLMPIIPALSEAKAGRSLEAKSKRPAWLTWPNPGSTKNTKIRPGAVAHTCISALWKAKVGGSLEVRSSRPACPTRRNPVSTKNKTISQAWWWAPVILATHEAEAGESLKPWRRRLQWTGVEPLQSSLGDRARLPRKKRRKRKRKQRPRNSNWLLFWIF